MKKITLLKSLFVALMLSVFSFSVMGAEKLAYTIDFVNTRTADDSNALTTSNFISKVVKGGASYLSGCTATNKCYDGIGGVKLGTSSVTGSFALSLSAAGQIKASKVVVYTKQYKTEAGKFGLSVNDAPASEVLASSASGTVIVNDIVKTIKITGTAKRFYITKIEVYQNETSGDEDPILVAPVFSAISV